MNGYLIALGVVGTVLFALGWTALSADPQRTSEAIWCFIGFLVSAMMFSAGVLGLLGFYQWL